MNEHTDGEADHLVHNINLSSFIDQLQLISCVAYRMEPIFPDLSTFLLYAGERSSEKGIW